MNWAWLKTLVPYLSENHRYLARFHRTTGPYWAVLHIVFYFLCIDFLGLKEDWKIRFTAAALIFGNRIFIPRGHEPSLFQVIYIELALVFNLPFLFSYHLALNDMNSYWLASMVFSAVLYAFGAYPLSALTLYPLVCFGMLLLEGYDVGSTAMRPVVGTIIASWILICALLVIRHVQKKNALHIKDLEHQQEIAQKTIEQKEREERNSRKMNETLRKHYEIMETFVSPSVRKEIASGLDPRIFERVPVDLAILFTDIIGYTRATTELSPGELGNFVDGFFDGVIEGVFFNDNGEVDKLMGDAVMSLFNSSDKALLAYLEIRKRLDAINKNRLQEKQKLYECGIGLSVGNMIYGNFGNQRKLDRSVVGESVNDAQRIEKMTRLYGVDALATEAFIHSLSRPYRWCRPIDYAPVGRNRMVIFELFGHQSEEIRNFKEESREFLNDAIAQKLLGSDELYEEKLLEWIEVMQSFPGAEHDRFFMGKMKTSLPYKKVV